MLERVYIKNHTLLKDVDITFGLGLVVFTGASGSGKSVFFESLLSVFGIKTSSMQLAEVSLQDDVNDDELSVFSQKIVNNKNRYYINNQNISKKDMQTRAQEFISFLHVQDFSDFNSMSLTKLLDSFISSKDTKFLPKIELLESNYNLLGVLTKKLNTILKNQQEFIDKKEFLEFEVKKIQDLNPSPEEFEELMDIKKNLSKKEKIEEKLQGIEPVFDYENSIIDFLNDMKIDIDFINSFMLELREHMETSRDKLNELSAFDIEDVLNRIEDLSKLKQRYGSIEEAVQYSKEKEKELLNYEDIDFEKSHLQNQIQDVKIQVDALAKEISETRNKHRLVFEKDINYYSKRLYLDKVNIVLSNKSLDECGVDVLDINISGTACSKLSSGEINRLRLSLIALKNKHKKTKGVLILDEIDANLSGVESESVAKVLNEISKNYQVFSISHQPHLASYANQHFLVSKDNNVSSLKEISKKDRIEEIARMISGEDISTASIKLAQELYSRAK